jgi:hypothetical protein
LAEEIRSVNQCGHLLGNLLLGGMMMELDGFGSDQGKASLFR